VSTHLPTLYPPAAPTPLGRCGGQPAEGSRAATARRQRQGGSTRGGAAAATAGQEALMVAGVHSYG
jgi:hypothetical protein